MRVPPVGEPVLRLLDTVEVAPAVHEEEPTLLVRGDRMLRIRRPSRAVAEALSMLRHGLAEPDITAPDVRRLVDELSGLGWLTAEPPWPGSAAGWDRQVGWWSTLTADGQAAQRRVAAADVAVLGLGGIGAPVAQHLAAGGVGRLRLIDPDVVEPHNLNRQYLYGRADVGRAKVDAAADGLGRLTDTVGLQRTRLRVTTPADLDVLRGKVDLLVVAADRPADLMDTVWAWAAPRGVPVLGSGVGLGTGYWGPLLDPRRGHCWPCTERARRHRLSADERRLEDRGGPTPYSFGPTNAIIADHVARDGLLFLALGRCISLDRRVLLDVVGIPAGGAPQAAGSPGCRHTGGTA